MKKFEKKLKAYRSHNKRQEKISQNSEWASDVLQKMDKLYGLTQHSESLDNYTTLINCTTHSYHFKHKIEGTRTWSFFPSKPRWIRIDTYADGSESKRLKLFQYYMRQKMASIRNSLAGEDPYFALGYSKIYHSASRSFQFEVDFESEIDESNLDRVLNYELLDEISITITPHVILSGNRSVYIAFFVKTEISKQTWLRFYDSIRKFLIFEGKNDVHTFRGAGLRIPLSHHQKSHGLCRFLGTKTRNEVAEQYLKIQPDEVSEITLNSLSDQLISRFNDIHTLEYQGRTRFQSLADWEIRRIQNSVGEKKLPLGELWKNIDKIDNVDPLDEALERFLDESNSSLISFGIAPSSEDEILSTDERESLLNINPSLSLSSSSSPSLSPSLSVGYTKGAGYCARSPRRREYENYISEGIPEGTSTEILIRSDFVRYCFNKYLAPEPELKRIVEAGIDDASIKSNRLEKLEYMMALIANDSKISVSSKRSFDDVELEPEMVECLKVYNKSLKKADPRLDKKRHKDCLKYIFNMFCFYGPVCNIGIDDVVEALNLPNKAIASRLLNHFRGEFRIIRTEAEYLYDPKGKDGKKRIYELLASEEWPSSIDKNKRIKTQKEMEQETAEWIDALIDVEDAIMNAL